MKIKFLLISLLLLGCSTDKTQKAYYDVKLNSLVNNTFYDVWSDSLINIPISFNSKKVPSTELFSSIEYLPLQTTSESFFGTVDQIEITENQIIILDKKTRGVYVFDKTGKFLFKILKAGEGPTEYRIPKCIAFNPFHNRVEVLDNTLGIIQRYSAEDGSYLSTLDLGMGVRNFAALDKSNYLFVVDSYAFNDQRYAQVKGLQKQVLIAEEHDNKMNIVSQHVDYRENSGALNFGVNQNMRFDRKTGLPLVNVTFNDTIYEVREGHITRKYFLDFGKLSNQDDWFQTENLPTLFKKFEEGETTTITYFWDTLDFIYVNSKHHDFPTHCFYSKKSGQTRCFRKSDFMQSAGAFAIWPMGATDNELVYVMEPQEVYDIKKSVLKRINLLYPEAKPSDIETIIDTFYVAREKWEFLKLTESAILEDSNPVLVFAKPNFDAYN